MTETTPDPYKVTETREMTDSEYDDAKNAESAMLGNVTHVVELLESIPHPILINALRKLGWIG